MSATSNSLLTDQVPVSGECLRVLSAGNLTTNQTSSINDHLTRLDQLSNMSSSLNQYVSGSIGIMLYQIRGVQAFVNGSWQECLNQLNAAVEREKQVIADANSPTLGFARSATLLAIHLLLIYEKSTSSAKTAVRPPFSSSALVDERIVSESQCPVDIGAEQSDGVGQRLSQSGVNAVSDGE